MASQLAVLFLRRLQLPVVITDLDQERVDKGFELRRSEIDKLLASGGSPDAANRLQALISGTTELIDFARLRLRYRGRSSKRCRSGKGQVFADLEKHVSDRCILQ
jgi:3-hydroxyacyl-CoA dehydrogenase